MRSQKAFVGFDSKIKGFRCVDPDTRKISVTRDAIFHENVGENTLRTYDDNTDISLSEGEGRESMRHTKTKRK